jgi:thioredoxin-like negative regulator of GroEL
VAALLHFVAEWASAICEPHRAEVAAAAERLRTTVREVDIDEEPDLARRYGVPNVPAVAVEGYPGTLVVGALSADKLASQLIKMTSRQPGMETVIETHSAWDQIRGWWRNRKG